MSLAPISGSVSGWRPTAILRPNLGGKTGLMVRPTLAPIRTATASAIAAAVVRVVCRMICGETSGASPKA